MPCRSGAAPYDETRRPDLDLHRGDGAEGVAVELDLDGLVRADPDRPALQVVDPVVSPALLGGQLGRDRPPADDALGGEQHHVHRAVVGLGVVGLSELGRPPLVNPDPERVSALGTLGLAPVPGVVGVSATTGSASVLADLARGGWVVPARLPDGVSLASHRNEHDVLELDLDTPAGPVVVVERRGTLAAELAQHTAVSVAGRKVYLLTSEPWHVATQVGDVVVEIYAPDDDGPALDVLASLEDDERSPLVARVARGWSVLTQEISR